MIYQQVTHQVANTSIILMAIHDIDAPNYQSSLLADIIMPLYNPVVLKSCI